jgi:hypothetical protein
MNFDVAKYLMIKLDFDLINIKVSITKYKLFINLNK